MPDIRNHPAINYYKSAIPIVLAGDDPGSFGYNELTIDYYLAFMGWGLSLYDLREIANNSMRFSSISDNLKSDGLLKFENEWNSFINSLHMNICSNLTINLDRIIMKKMYPPYGPI